MTAAARFWPKVSGGSYEECWLWTAHISPQGYGQFRFGGRAVCAHRWAYEAMVADIPEGLHLDHLCRVPACVNPYHLDPVTVRENLTRGARGAYMTGEPTRCPQGHERTPENLYSWTADGYPRRVCRLCNRARVARYRALRRAKEHSA